MAFDQEVGWNILLVMLCINGMIGVGSTLVNVPLKSPFDIVQNVTATTQPQIVNFTSPNGTLLSNVTTGVYNVTANNNPLVYMVNNTFYLLALIYIFAQFVSGAFIWNAMLAYHMPLQFVALVASIVYALIARSIVYYVTGR
jgi:hypothetical protein